MYNIHKNNVLSEFSLKGDLLDIEGCFSFEGVERVFFELFACLDDGLPSSLDAESGRRICDPLRLAV